jgi:hypothetical protein
MLHFAYLDPTSGSLFIQTSIGLIAGGLFIFRDFVVRLSTRFVSVFRRSDEQ